MTVLQTHREISATELTVFLLVDQIHQLPGVAQYAETQTTKQTGFVS